VAWSNNQVLALLERCVIKKSVSAWLEDDVVKKEYFSMAKKEAWTKIQFQHCWTGRSQ
jgi:hypothetical protein